MSATLAKIPYTNGLGLTLDRIVDGEVQMTLPDGTVRSGMTGRDGLVVIGTLDPGQVDFTLTGVDAGEWGPK